MGNDENWICLHRRIVQSEVFKSPTIFRFFTYLLCHVADECEERLVGVGDEIKKVVVCGGEVVIEFEKISSDLGITASTVSKNLQRLEAMGVINRIVQGGITRAVFVNYANYQAARDHKVSPRSYYDLSCLGEEIDLTDFRPCKLSTKGFIEAWSKYVAMYERRNPEGMSVQYAEASLSALEGKYGNNPLVAEAAVNKQTEKLRKSAKKSSGEIADKAELFIATYPKIRRNAKAKVVSSFSEAVDRLMSAEVVRIAGYTKTFSSKSDAADFLILRASKFADSDYVKEKPDFVPAPCPWLNGEKYLEEAWDADLMSKRKSSGSNQASVDNSKEAESFIKDITRRTGK